MSLGRKILRLACVIAGLSFLICACGADGVEQLDMSLTFSPQDLPQDSESVRYYVLPSALSDSSLADCADFMGADAVKNVLDYGSDFLANGEEDVSSISGVTLAIKELPEGRLMFYVEALSAAKNVLACGCGQAEIEKGKKTTIPIRVIEDCR
jgi:hypothetical protein